MIYLDGIGLSFLIKETKENIIGYKLTKIYQYDKVSFSFYFGKKNLLFQVKDNSSVFYIKDSKDLNTDFNSKFLLTLKKYLLNSFLINVRQENYDRIVYFDFEKLNQFGDIEKYTLVMEIMGKASNVFLLNENNKIICSLYFLSIEMGNRVIMPGSEYKLPFLEKKYNPKNLSNQDFPITKDEFINNVEGVGNALAEECKDDFDKFKDYLINYSPILYEQKIENKIKRVITYNKFKEFSSYNLINSLVFPTITEALNEYFKITITSNVINDKKKKILKYVENQIKKSNKILENIIKDIDKNKDYNKFKNYGDILAANMSSIKYGMDRVNFYDFYEFKNVEIQLNPTLYPKDNLNHYYNRYNKGKRTILALENRLIEVKDELKYFENMKFFIENEDDFVGIEEIEEELGLTKNNKTKIKLNRSKNRELKSIDFNGFKIFIGRNNKENEEISFGKGMGDDIWLHIKDRPGSHILIVKGNKKIDDSVILFAAKLAAKNSKAMIGDKVIVDYCEKRFLKKIKGSKPGNVIYTNYRSIQIVVD